MRIVENSASYLRLQESSSRLAFLLLIAAAILMVAAIVRRGDPRLLINAALFGVSALFFRRTSRTELDKSARRCRIARLDMWRRSDRSVAFEDIRDVRVEVMQPDTSVQPHARISIITHADQIPLTAGYMPDLSGQIAIREVMVDAIFTGRNRPAPLDPAQVLRDGGRPLFSGLLGIDANVGNSAIVGGDVGYLSTICTTTSSATR